MGEAFLSAWEQKIAEHEENIRIIPLIEKELEEVEAILEDMKYWRDDIEHEFEPDSLPFNFLSTSKVVTYLLILVPILLNVAFIALLERKILAFSQFRLGPNKVSWVGFLQPIADALKLFSNQVRTPFRRNLIIYILSPVYKPYAGTNCMNTCAPEARLFKCKVQLSNNDSNFKIWSLSSSSLRLSLE